MKMKLSQPQKIVAFLKSNPNQKFTARKIAEAILNLYPQDYLEKRNNPRFSTDAELINQIVAEIGAHKNAILKA